MKLLSKILFALTCIHLTCIAQDMVDNHMIIQPYITVWQDEYIPKLSTQEIIIIADVLLLTYEIVQASVIMAQARLTMQTEILNIVTLSIHDTFDARMQAQNNDLTNIKNAIATIEESQIKIKSACNALKNFGPLLINIDPTVIQIFISNLKDVILSWAKTQQDLVTELEALKEEFITTTNLFSNFKTIFDTIIITNPVEHNQLLHGANSLADMYKKTENFLGYLTVIRQESLANFNRLLTLYFKSHYKILYDLLQNIDYTESTMMSHQNKFLPDPEQIFVLG